MPYDNAIKPCSTALTHAWSDWQKRKTAFPSSSQLLVFSWHLYLVTLVLCICWLCCYYRPQCLLGENSKFSYVILKWQLYLRTHEGSLLATAVGTFRVFRATSTGTSFSFSIISISYLHPKLRHVEDPKRVAKTECLHTPTPNSYVET